jgi:Putative transposase
VLKNTNYQRSIPPFWKKDWGVHLQPFGNGEHAIKYLARYVNRRAIGDSRILSVTDAKQIQRMQMPSFFWFFICVNLGLSAV